MLINPPDRRGGTLNFATVNRRRGAAQTVTVTAIGSFPSARVQGHTGSWPLDASTGFTTSDSSSPTYSLTAAPADITINASTGVVTVPTNTLRSRNAPVTVTATAGASSASQTFNLTVGPKLGIAVPKSEIFGYSAAELDVIFQRFYSLGLRDYRMDMIWMDVQPNNTAVNWATYPANEYIKIAGRAAAAGINLIFCVHMTPAWARLSGANYNGPSVPSHFASFCADVATTFTASGRTLKALEIWNEPNLTGPNTFWQYGRPISELVAMQTAAYTAVKAVRPTMLVGMGGLAAVPATRSPVDPSFQYIAATETITAMYAAGLKDYNDFIAIHPYTYPFTWNDGVANNDGYDVMMACRTIVTSNGDGGKAWWLTEYGAPTNPPITASSAVTETQQRQMLYDIFDWGGQNAWVAKVFWYSYYDRSATTSTDPENGFGIYHYDEVYEKLIVDAFRQIKLGSV